MDGKSCILSTGGQLLKKYKAVDRITFDICTCGHAWHEHECTNLVVVLRQIWPGNWGKPIADYCEECACPRFEFYSKLTWRDWNKLKRDMETDNISMYKQ